jgi:hypothetical protein
MSRFGLRGWFTVLAALLAFALVAAACGDDDDDESTGGSTSSTEQETSSTSAAGGEDEFEVQLAPLNDSGVTGTAEVSLEGDQVTVKIEAKGMVPGQPHAQHIHGLDSGNATCPGDDLDTDGDGIISVQEGAPAYGDILVDLQPYPAADADGSITYDKSLAADDVAPLPDRVVVLHGLNSGGKYDGSIPVACVEIG